MKISNQFSYEAGDIDTTMPTDAKYLPTYIAAMIAIEAEHPGSIPNAFRQMALANYDFKVKSRCSQPELSMEAQKALSDWILDIYNHMSEGQEGGADYE
jgi:hypothetical protein